MSVPLEDDVQPSNYSSGNKNTPILTEAEPLGSPDASLAPKEPVGVLGQEVTLFSAIMLDVGQMTGSGIYSVTGSILYSVGSIGLLLTYWVLSPLFASAALSIYTEYASMFSRRSGAEVVYLEQAYPKPRFLVSVTYATVVLLTSMNASNAIIFSQYFLSAFEVPVTTTNQTIAAVTVVFITAAIVICSTKWAVRAVNILTSVKVIALSFMVVSGLAVLTGNTRIKEPYANFQHPFKGSSLNANALSTAFIKSNHSFIGWANAFNVIGEIRSDNPALTVRKAGRISLVLVSFLYLFINVAYIAAIPIDEIRSSGQLIAFLFFQRIFGSRGAVFFPLLVSLSCFGNIIAVNLGQARVVREIARQGLLPFPAFFSSTKPFGTPFGPVILRSAYTIAVLLIVPAKDAFNFIMDLVSYPNLVFQCAIACGLWVIRGRRHRMNISSAPLKANSIVITIYFTACVLLLVLPWVPPEPGRADVSFWYATYCVGGIGLLVFCGIYYWLWIIYLPARGGYEIVEKIEESSDGVRNTKLTRRYKVDSSENDDDERRPLLPVITT